MSYRYYVKYYGFPIWDEENKRGKWRVSAEFLQSWNRLYVPDVIVTEADLEATSDDDEGREAIFYGPAESDGRGLPFELDSPYSAGGSPAVYFGVRISGEMVNSFDSPREIAKFMSKQPAPASIEAARLVFVEKAGKELLSLLEKHGITPAVHILACDS